MQVEKKINTLIQKHSRLEKLNEEKAELSRDIYNLEQEVYDEMQERDMDKISMHGIDFKLHIDTNFKLGEGLSKWDNPKFFSWLKKNGYEGVIKTRASVHANTRTATLKTHMEEGGELPPFIQAEYVPQLKYNRSAMKRLVKES